MSERARVERQSRKTREMRVADSHARGHVRVSRISLDRLRKKTVVSLKFKVCSGGNSHIKGVGMLVGNFELRALRETNLGVAQPFFDP